MAQRIQTLPSNPAVFMKLGIALRILNNNTQRRKNKRTRIWIGLSKLYTSFNSIRICRIAACSKIGNKLWRNHTA